jgi:hypothetical protein
VRGPVEKQEGNSNQVKQSEKAYGEALRSADASNVQGPAKWLAAGTWLRLGINPIVRRVEIKARDEVKS